MAVVITAEAEWCADARFFLGAIVIATKTERHAHARLFLGAIVVRAPLADAVWNLLRQHFTNRVVLEMDDLHFMSSALMGELVRLYKRVEGRGGLMRLSGLSSSNLDVLRLTRLDRCFPHFATRADAVMGIRGGGHS